MPLTTCPDCGGEVSSAARACPHCGRPSGLRGSPLTEAVIGGCLLIGVLAVPALLLPVGLLVLIAVVCRARTGSGRRAITTGVAIGLLGVIAVAVFGNSPGMIVVIWAVCLAAVGCLVQGRRVSRRLAADGAPPTA